MNKFILILLLLLLLFVIFQNPFKLGFQDWDSFYAYAEHGKVSLEKFRQLPLWNPYHCGGMVQVGVPADSFWSPLIFPILLFGPVVGFKLQFFIYILFGFLGMFSLG